MSHTAPVLTVSDLNYAIKAILESELLFQDCSIVGEVSNLRHYQLGKQVYFNLLDGNSSINCVIYDAHKKKGCKTLENGQKITARGRLTVFHKKGGYTFQVAYFLEDGKGMLSNSFEQLKTSLLKEGLFDNKHKQPIPRYPEHIAIITAPNSAALSDYLKISKAETPHIELSIVPATMQGKDSPRSIINALAQCEGLPHVDLIVLMRGGGSAEDLAPFNDETLVRTLFQTQTPVITAIGHELDYTLSDFVSDLRTATPTAAAQHVAQPFQDFKLTLEQRLHHIKRSILEKIDYHHDNIQNWQSNAHATLIRHCHNIEHTVQEKIKRLHSSNPALKLLQGYSITRHKDKILKNCKTVQIDDTIHTELSNGSIYSTVTSIKPS